MSVYVSVIFVVVTAWNIAATDGATAEGTIRLVNGYNASEGRVEIYLQGQWGTICDDHWDIREAIVVCQQLGFLDAISAVGNAKFGKGSGPIQLDDLLCVGNESALINCSANPIREHDCGHSEDAGVRCDAYASSSAEGTIRLVNGNNASEGRVEITLQGHWGTVCDDLWDIREATVVCKQLGFLDAISAVGNAEFGEGSGPIQLNDLLCVGNESTLINCSTRPIKQHSCNHSEDAGVRCNPCPLYRQIRLVGGTNSREGRVEVRNGCYGNWGTVCDNQWDNTDAQTACCQLGYNTTAGAVASSSARFGQGTGDILLSDLKCSGNESSLFECPHDRNTIDCRHDDDAGASCPPCYEIVSNSTRVARLRTESYKEYYRIGFWNWGRQSRTVYRSVTYYVYVITYSKQEVPCPVNGGWGSWILGKCNVTCGKGYLNCTRECNNPAPAHGGSDCVGSNSEVQPCDEGCCPVDGGWSDWNVGSCSVTCGGGIKEKFRLCDNPTPSCGGKWCNGSNKENEECNESPCK